MNKKMRLMSLLAVLALVLAVGVIAQQKSADTAVDPVCGMTVTKAKAAATFDYKGTTYYFCNTGCKDAFAKDPEKYLQAAKAKAAAPAAPMAQMSHMGQMGEMGKGQEGMMKHAMPAGQAGACPMMQGGMGGEMGQGMCGCQMMGGKGMMPGHMGMGGRGMMAPGMGMLFRLYGDKVEVTVENTKDGAMLKFASKDPEVVKAIQVHLAEHLAMMKKMMEAAAKPATGGAAEKESGQSCGPNCPMKK